MSWHHHQLLCGWPETLPTDNVSEMCATVNKVPGSIVWHHVQWWCPYCFWVLHPWCNLLNVKMGITVLTDWIPCYQSTRQAISKRRWTLVEMRELNISAAVSPGAQNVICSTQWLLSIATTVCSASAADEYSTTANDDVQSAAPDNYSNNNNVIMYAPPPQPMNIQWPETTTSNQPLLTTTATIIM